MKKTLFSLLMASSLLIPTGNAKLNQETPVELYTQNNKEPQELYPNLRGDGVVSIYFDLRKASVSIEFDTNKDNFGDTKYVYPFTISENKNYILLKHPTFVTFDKNRNQKIDEEEIFDLKGKTSKKSIENPTINNEKFPILKGDDPISIEYSKFSGDPSIFIQYDTSGNGRADLMYAHQVGKVGKAFENKKHVGNVIVLRSPSAVIFDENENGLFEEELFYLDRKTEEPKSEKPIEDNTKKDLTAI